MLISFFIIIIFLNNHYFYKLQIQSRTLLTIQYHYSHYLQYNNGIHYLQYNSKLVFILPHTVSSEPYVGAFQYKVLNSLLFTNTKLFKIGIITEDKCSFCKSDSETSSHLLFDCIKTKSFWRDFKSYFYSLSKEFVHLTLKDVIVGIIITECPLLNYLLLIAKIYLGDCRRTQILPNITGFKLKVKNKFETEKYVCMKNNTLDKLNKKWLINK